MRQEQMEKKTKFTNPAERFFSEVETTQENMKEPAPKKQETKPENRTRRVQAYLTPSLHKEATKKAKAEGISLNDAINLSLEEYTKDVNSNANGNS